MWGGIKSIILLGGSQALSARFSDQIRMKVKMLERLEAVT
jgi:hypothetical protein